MIPLLAGLALTLGPDSPTERRHAAYLIIGLLAVLCVVDSFLPISRLEWWVSAGTLALGYIFGKAETTGSRR